jgi:gamma-glutamylcyclotransferase (GGCT)/AIG2-like uncharacterized protein YtfP
MTGTVRLFSYGTLQQREVQLTTYGRLLDGEPDSLTGFRLEDIAIGRDDVVEISGKAVHTIARRTGNPADRISGTLYWLTGSELQAADAYEDSAYKRIAVTLESGRDAWVYVDGSLEGDGGPTSL